MTKPRRPLKLHDYIVIAGSLICMFSFFTLMKLQTWAPKRELNQTQNLMLLWKRDVENDYNQIHPNDDYVMVYEDNKLTTYDLETGEINWQIDIPSPSIIAQYEDRIYISSNKWFDDAPINADQEFPMCLFGGSASLSIYDADTGNLIWRYGYQGVSADTLILNEQYAYLEGYSNQNTARAITEIDAEDGHIVFHDCSWDVRERTIPHLPDDQSFHAGKRPYQIVFDEDVILYSQSNTISFFDTKSNTEAGWVSFKGIRLNGLETRSYFIEEKVILHFEDSNQLYVFGLAVEKDE